MYPTFLPGARTVFADTDSTVTSPSKVWSKDLAHLERFLCLSSVHLDDVFIGHPTVEPFIHVRKVDEVAVRAVSRLYLHDLKQTQAHSL